MFLPVLPVLQRACTTVKDARGWPAAPFPPRQDGQIAPVNGNEYAVEPSVCLMVEENCALTAEYE